MSQDILTHFLGQSLRSLAYSTLPFVNAAQIDPGRAITLDDQFDATVTCPVARRASIAQGKALVTIWERAFLEDKSIAEEYRASVKEGKGGHFGVAWGVVCFHCDISRGIVHLGIRVDGLERGVFVFLLNHAKAVMSAAVRLGLVGPYQAQSILAASSTRKLLRDTLDEVQDLDVEDAGQTWALLDVYQGRQEILYSRVFNG